MRFLSIYRSKETNEPPTPERMAEMGKLIEEMTREGTLIHTAGLRPTADQRGRRRGVVRII